MAAKTCSNFRFLIGGRRYPEGRRFNVVGVLVARYVKNARKKFDASDVMLAIGQGRRGDRVARALGTGTIPSHWVESWLKSLRRPGSMDGHPNADYLAERCPSISDKTRRLWRGR